MASKIPTEMKAWQYRKTTGGLENHLELNTIPLPKPKAGQHLVRVIASSINPVDYKIAESGMGAFVTPNPGIPGVDVAGEIITPASGSSLKAGQLVFGWSAGALAAKSALAQYTLMDDKETAVIPQGVSPTDIASLPVTAITALQSLKAPNTKPGDRVFWNGGSGGVGVFAIQIAKILGLHITVSCSGRNADLVRGLGADEVVDYTKGDLVAQLEKLPYKFDMVVDAVGGNHDLFWQAHRYTKPSAVFRSVAFSPSPKDLIFAAKASLLPSMLGGGKRKLAIVMAVLETKDLTTLAGWMAEGKLKAVLDSTWKLEQVPEAFRKVKTGRARGKVVIEIAKA